MRTRRAITVMSLLAAVLMLFASVAQAANPRPQPIRERLEATFAGIEVPAPEGRCSKPAALLHYVGQGTISRIGKVTMVSSHCSYVTDTGEPSGRYGEAEMVIKVTDSLDEIYGTYSGYQLDETRYLEFLRIKGGTGQFADVRGSLIEIVTVDLESFNVSIRGWGWMLR